MKQKRTLKMLLLTLTFSSLLVGCSKKDKAIVDTEYPTIDATAALAFPQQCSELTRGTATTVKIFVSDNVELGSVSIDIHHNFDHHSHSTEVTACDMENKKTPVNPLLYIKSIPVPPGHKTYTVTQEIAIPANADPGDYHFMIRATDKEGWQSIKGLSIKLK